MSVDQIIGNDATRRMVALIATAALERIDNAARRTPFSNEEQKSDAALDFVVGYIAGIKACGMGLQADRLASEFSLLLGPLFYENLRKTVERAKVYGVMMS